MLCHKEKEIGLDSNLDFCFIGMGGGGGGGRVFVGGGEGVSHPLPFGFNYSKDAWVRGMWVSNLRATCCLGVWGRKGGRVGCSGHHHCNPRRRARGWQLHHVWKNYCSCCSCCCCQRHPPWPSTRCWQSHQVWNWWARLRISVSSGWGTAGDAAPRHRWASGPRRRAPILLSGQPS